MFKKIKDFINMVKFAYGKHEFETAGKNDRDLTKELIFNIRMRTWTVALLSLLFAGFSLFTLFISSNPSQNQEKAAFFLIGALISYWFAPDFRKTLPSSKNP